jgi:hypothetical protein
MLPCHAIIDFDRQVVCEWQCPIVRTASTIKVNLVQGSCRVDGHMKPAGPGASYADECRIPQITRSEEGPKAW